MPPPISETSRNNEICLKSTIITISIANIYKIGKSLVYIANTIGTITIGEFAIKNIIKCSIFLIYIQVKLTKIRGMSLSLNKILDVFLSLLHILKSLL